MYVSDRCGSPQPTQTYNRRSHRRLYVFHRCGLPQPNSKSPPGHPTGGLFAVRATCGPGLAGPTSGYGLDFHQTRTHGDTARDRQPSGPRAARSALSSRPRLSDRARVFRLPEIVEARGGARAPLPRMSEASGDDGTLVPCAGETQARPMGKSAAIVEGGLSVLELPKLSRCRAVSRRLARCRGVHSPQPAAPNEEIRLVPACCAGVAG